MPFAAMAFARVAAFRASFADEITTRDDTSTSFTDESPEVWFEVWQGLGEFGLSGLTALTTYPDPRVRDAANAVLRRLKI